MPPKKQHIGKLPPRYTLVHSPLVDSYMETCLVCGNRMRRRLHEFLVYVEPLQLQGVKISMTTCTRCEMIIFDDPRFEDALARAFAEDGRTIFIGNAYRILGTLSPSINRLDADVELDLEETCAYLHDIKDHVFSDDFTDEE